MQLKQYVKSVPDFPKKGVTFQDLSPLFMNSAATQQLVTTLQSKITKVPTKMLVLESRGYLIGAMMAQNLKVGFAMCRKPNKLPPPVLSTKFNLEYKTDEGFEIEEGLFNKDDIVLIHDDILATGGTALAAVELLIRSGVKKENIELSFIGEIKGLGGRDKIKEYKWFAAMEL